MKRPEEPAPPTQEELLRIMDQAEQNVAIFTGIKVKYIEAGWTQRGAEQMVLAQIQAVSGASQ